jgi:manganese/iron transport system ATP-binding protein
VTTAEVGSGREDGAGIAVRSATVTYRNGHTALVDASFAVPTGTITALVGMNGSGKSTLFKAIMGFVPWPAGRSPCWASRCAPP